MKIGVVGCGKRFINNYSYILESLNYDVFLWNRTTAKAVEMCKTKNFTHVDNLEDFKSLELDLLLCFVPSKVHYDILTKLPKLNCKILVETPGEDHRIISFENVGVLEQWPKLPLEQFKEKIYKNNLLSRPYLTFNDGRSLDYHAMAQLRTYLQFPLPEVAKGTNREYPQLGQLDCNQKLNNNSNDWTIGQIEMSNGSLLLHSFAYNCKSLPSIPIQFLRSYSKDGSIVTGRMKQLGNDYEIIDVRYVDKLTKETKIAEIEVQRSNNTTHSLFLKDADIRWSNPYSHLQFDDQQTAIATLIDEGLNGKIYSYQNAFIDGVCINMIKQSGYQQQVIKLR